jgi:hypothetical protein
MNTGRSADLFDYEISRAAAPEKACGREPPAKAVHELNEVVAAAERVRGSKADASLLARIRCSAIAIAGLSMYAHQGALDVSAWNSSFALSRAYASERRNKLLEFAAR